MNLLTKSYLKFIIAFSLILSHSICLLAQYQQNKLQPPLAFERNIGQTAEEVAFLHRSSQYTLFLHPEEIVLALKNNKALRLNVLNNQFEGEILGEKLLPGKVNYLKGKDPQKWITAVPTYQSVSYPSIYPGVDLVFHGSQNQQLEYDFVVAPGADPNCIRFNFEGIESLGLNTDGSLSLKLANGELTQLPPVIYQEIGDIKLEIEGAYQLIAEDEIGFEIADYDADYPLVIDPVLLYSTYLGGTGTEIGMDIDTDSEGNAYVVGFTSSEDFPTQDEIQTDLDGEADAFVAKFDPEGGLIYSTYLGGSENDSGADIAVTTDGGVVITGYTYSRDFPLQNPIDNTMSGTTDAFVAKLDEQGAALVFSTFLGGRAVEFGYGIAVDITDDVYVVGYTSSEDFPTVNPFQANSGGSADAFVSRLRSDGSALVYSSYLGGSGHDCFEGAGAFNNFPNIRCAVAVAEDQSVVVAGITASSDFPVASPLQANLMGVEDAFVTKINPDGGSLSYSTYLGGQRTEYASSVAVNATGDAFVTGRTESEDFPVTGGVVQSIFGGSNDAYVSRISTDGNVLQFSTFLGGERSDWANGIDLSPNEEVWVTGNTESDNFPTATPFQEYTGSRDGFISGLNPNGNAYVYSTYFGGSSTENAMGISVDSASSIYISGGTNSEDFPTLQAFQPDLVSAPDAFVTKFGQVPETYDYEYVAKVVCGVQKNAEDLRLARGLYATTINVHSPELTESHFFKKLALTYPPGGQIPGAIMPIAVDTLQEDEALAVDCIDLQDRLFPDGFPAPYIEGFVVIQSTQKLDVTAVYSTSALEGNPLGDHSSIDVEKVPERDRRVDLAVEKQAACYCFEVTDNLDYCYILYEILVTNEGENDAYNVQVIDEITRVGDPAQGSISVVPDIYEILPGGGDFTILDQTGQEATVQFDINEIQSGNFATLRFWAISISSETPQTILNTATVGADQNDQRYMNNSVTIQTILSQGDACLSNAALEGQIEKKYRGATTKLTLDKQMETLSTDAMLQKMLKGLVGAKVILRK